MIKVAELSELIKRGNDVLVRGEVLSGKTIAVLDASRDAGMDAVIFDQSFNHITDLNAQLDSYEGDTLTIGDPEEKVVYVILGGESIEDGDGTIDVLRELTQNRMVNGVLIANLHAIVITHDSEVEVNDELAELFDTVTEP